MAQKSHILTKRQEQFLTAFKTQLGIVTAACRAVNINRRTYYRWRKESPYFASLADDAQLELKDFGESTLLKLMKEGNPAAVIFFNKCKNKDRGYVEKTEVEHSSKGITIITEIPESVKELFDGKKV